jgi:hypothetical protein
VSKVKSKPIHRTIGLVWRKHSASSEGYQRIADVIRAAVTKVFKDITVI